MAVKLKCTQFIEQHLKAYLKDGDLFKLLKNMLADARNYGTDTHHYALIKELERICIEQGVSR